MQKIVIDLGCDEPSKNKEVRLPKCWICNDMGFVIYYKKKNGISYEVGSRCKCKLGQEASNEIPTVHDKIAEEAADINFSTFKKNHPDKIKDLVG